MIGQQLHFDVPGVRDAALEEHCRVAEGGAGFRAGRPYRAEEVGTAGHCAHALAAAARHGLHQQRKANVVRQAQQVVVRRVSGEWLGRAWHHRHTGAHGDLTRGGLAAHQRHGFGGRPDVDQAGAADRGCEVFVLGEEAIARMDRVGTAAQRHLDDRVDAQVAVTRRAGPNWIRLVGVADMQRAAVAFGINRDRRDLHLATGADDANGNFAAVGDEDLSHGFV